MRITMVRYGVLLAALGLWGCASDVGEDGTSLRRVDEQRMTSELLYMMPGAAVPMTLAELEAQEVDQTLAVPVRVEIFDTVAVAWFAPAGEAVIGRDNIVALWKVYERQPISDEIAPDEIGTVTEPDELPELSVPTLEVDQQLEQPLTEPVGVTALDNPIGETIIQFVDQIGSYEEAWMMAQVAESHPGCI